MKGAAPGSNTDPGAAVTPGRAQFRKQAWVPHLSEQGRVARPIVDRAARRSVRKISPPIGAWARAVGDPRTPVADHRPNPHAYWLLARGAL